MAKRRRKSITYVVVAIPLDEVRTEKQRQALADDVEWRLKDSFANKDIEIESVLSEKDWKDLNYHGPR